MKLKLIFLVFAFLTVGAGAAFAQSCGCYDEYLQTFVPEDTLSDCNAYSDLVEDVVTWTDCQPPAGYCGCYIPGTGESFTGVDENECILDYDFAWQDCPGTPTFTPTPTPNPAFPSCGCYDFFDDFVPDANTWEDCTDFGTNFNSFYGACADTPTPAPTNTPTGTLTPTPTFTASVNCGCYDFVNGVPVPYDNDQYSCEGIGGYRWIGPPCGPTPTWTFTGTPTDTPIPTPTDVCVSDPSLCWTPTPTPDNLTAINIAMAAAPGTPTNNDNVSVQTSTGEPVNTFNGDAWNTTTDFNYSRNGFPLKFERYFHNGITSPFGEMGPGWMSNYDICLYIPYGSNTTEAVLVMPHQTWVFSTSDQIHFTAPAGCFYQLQLTPSNGYVLTDKSGITFTFVVLPHAEPNIARLTQMQDLNLNKVSLQYQPLTYSLTMSYTTGQNILSGIQGLRLSTVSGNNWGVTFSYFDNLSPTPTPFPVGSKYGTITWTNTYGNRLKTVTNSAGDVLTFDNGIGQPGPIASVSRSPSTLNASYQYYQYIANPPLGSPATVTTLKQIIDPMQPAGYRNITFVSEKNPNSLNNPVRQIINNLGQVMYTYDYSTDASGNKLTSTSGPNGLMETDVYDTTGRWIQKRFVLDGHPFNEVYTWNVNNLMTKIVDGNGHAVNMTYDALGNLIYRQDPEGNQEYYTYNGISRLINSTDKNQVSRSYLYDSNGNLLQEQEPGRTTNYQYSFTTSGPNIGALNQKTIIDGNTHITTYQYDANGNAATIIAPGATGLLAISIIVHDHYPETNGTGRNTPVTMIDALGVATSNSYTNGTWLTGTQYADGTSESYLHDLDGDVTQLTDRNLHITKYNYDPADRLVKTVQGFGLPEERDTSYTLDAQGNKTVITEMNGNKTTFVYNEQNLVRSMTDSVGKGYSNTYDGALNPATTKDTRGITKTMAYYKNNRLQSTRFSDGTPSISYTYDGNGNRTGMTDATGVKTYSYDSLNRLQTVSDATRNFNISYTYDAVGNRRTMSNNKVSGTMNYSYYPNNLLSGLTDADGMSVSYTYDSLKAPKTVIYPNGVTMAYAYIPTNHRLQSLQNLNSHGEVLATFSYVYDGVGNATTITDNSGAATYTYDGLNQLINAAYPGPQGRGTISYAYDKAGNRTLVTQNGTSQNYVYNPGGGNELTSTSGTNGESFTYDKAGNMLSRISATVTKNYSWDGQNQLITLKIVGGQAVTYVYDGDGHRAQKITAQGTTNYFYDGSSVIAETDGSGKIQNKYDPGISVTDQQGSKLFYLYDGHGDVAGLVDTKQNLVQNYEYDPFGNTVGDQKDANHSRYVGSGGVYSDDDTNLQNMWHRWYDSKLGRFVSRDPIGLSGGTNLYVYVSNNPIRSTDINGFCASSDEEALANSWFYGPALDVTNRAFDAAGGTEPTDFGGTFSDLTPLGKLSFGVGVVTTGMSIANDFHKNGNTANGWSDASGEVAGFASGFVGATTLGGYGFAVGGPWVGVPLAVTGGFLGDKGTKELIKTIKNGPPPQFYDPNLPIGWNAYLNQSANDAYLDGRL